MAEINTPWSQVFAQTVANNLDYWLAFLQSGDSPSESQLREHDTILRAVEFGLQLTATRSQALKLIPAAFPLIEARTSWYSWIGLLIWVAENFTDGSPGAHCQLLNQLGALNLSARQYQTALNYFHQAETLACTVADPYLIGSIQLGLCQTYWHISAYAQAKNYGESVLALLKQEGLNSEQVAACLNVLGMLAHTQGEYKSAKRYWKRVVTIRKKTGDTQRHAQALHNLAMTQNELGQYKHALKNCIKASQLLDHAAESLDRIKLDILRGQIHLKTGDCNLAGYFLQRADKPALRNSADFTLRARLATHQGDLAQAKGNWKVARFYYEQAVQYWEQTNEWQSRANTLIALAKTYKILDDNQAAGQRLKTANEIIQANPISPQTAKLLRRIAKARKVIAS
ncbi:MAG: tetratricopeptide repeat protein [Anaerolineales bacterium]|nr:tetratricopeptide repeat protein [Anaerolineales bacterium]